MSAAAPGEGEGPREEGRDERMYVREERIPFCVRCVLMIYFRFNVNK